MGLEGALPGDLRHSDLRLGGTRAPGTRARHPEPTYRWAKVLGAPAVHGKYSTKSDSRIKDLGMTKYVKTSDGSYERTVGNAGPTMIREPKKQ